MVSELRSDLLRDHREIRRRLDQIEELAVDVASGGSDRSRPLCVRGQELLAWLEERAQWEERQLLPAIHRVHGIRRAARAREDLITRRELLRFQLDGLTEHRWPPSLVAGGLLDYASLLRTSLDEEEQLFLIADTPLEDDVFVEVFVQAGAR